MGSLQESIKPHLESSVKEVISKRKPSESGKGLPSAEDAGKWFSQAELESIVTLTWTKGQGARDKSSLDLSKAKTKLESDLKLANQNVEDLKKQLGDAQTMLNENLEGAEGGKKVAEMIKTLAARAVALDNREKVIEAKALDIDESATRSSKVMELLHLAEVARDKVIDLDILAKLAPEGGFKDRAAMERAADTLVELGATSKAKGAETPADETPSEEKPDEIPFIPSRLEDGGVVSSEPSNEELDKMPMSQFAEQYRKRQNKEAEKAKPK